MSRTHYPTQLVTGERIADIDRLHRELENPTLQTSANLPGPVRYVGNGKFQIDLADDQQHFKGARFYHRINNRPFAESYIRKVMRIFGYSKTAIAKFCDDAFERYWLNK